MKLILGVVIALLAGLVFLVIAEPLVPSESVPGPVYVLRGARGRMGRAGRYWQISRILARRGAAAVCRSASRRQEAPVRRWRGCAGCDSRRTPV
ncbi:MAG: hypothetical protein ACRDOH_25365, partial [Streptosporangiaceae bacterium]